MAPTFLTASATQAVEEYGPLKVSLRGLRRIGRCNAFHPGGEVPPQLW